MIEDIDPADLAGNRAWRELEATLRPFVAKRVREADVDDVVQDVFVRIQRGLPSLRDHQRFGPWVYQVTRSAIADHGRTASRHPYAESNVAEARDQRSDIDDRAVAREVATYAAAFVSMLPSPYREALTLTELQGLTQKDAAQRVGISVSGMKSRVQRGRHKLRAALEHCCHIALDARYRVVGCEPRPDGTLPPGCCPARPTPMLSIDFIYDDDCPHVDAARAHLKEALAVARRPPTWSEHRIGDPSVPHRVRGFGSPTILVDGRDVAGQAPQAELCCRIYPSGGGVPSVELIIAALQDAGQPIPSEGRRPSGRTSA